MEHLIGKKWFSGGTTLNYEYGNPPIILSLALGMRVMAIKDCSDIKYGQILTTKQFSIDKHMIHVSFVEKTEFQYYPIIDFRSYEFSSVDFWKKLNQ